MAHVAGRLAVPGTRLIDLGAGYGGGARFLASRFGCRVLGACPTYDCLTAEPRMPVRFSARFR